MCLGIVATKIFSLCNTIQQLRILLRGRGVSMRVPLIIIDPVTIELLTSTSRPCCVLFSTVFSSGVGQGQGCPRQNWRLAFPGLYPAIFCTMLVLSSFVFLSPFLKVVRMNHKRPPKSRPVQSLTPLQPNGLIGEMAQNRKFSYLSLICYSSKVQFIILLLLFLK